jgi:hypothetical protein
MLVTCSGPFVVRNLTNEEHVIREFFKHVQVQHYNIVDGQL